MTPNPTVQHHFLHFKLFSKTPDLRQTHSFAAHSGLRSSLVQEGIDRNNRYFRTRCSYILSNFTLLFSSAIEMSSTSTVNFNIKGLILVGNFHIFYMSYLFSGLVVIHSRLFSVFFMCYLVIKGLLYLCSFDFRSQMFTMVIPNVSILSHIYIYEHLEFP